SIVVISWLVTSSAVVIHERIAAPSASTVQAPQTPSPHPYLVPVRPNSSRNTSSNGLSGSVSTVSCFPLTVKAIDCGIRDSSLLAERGAASRRSLLWFRGLLAPRPVVAELIERAAEGSLQFADATIERLVERSALVAHRDGLH